jgi:molecular chaperone GrpE (heat shock protein)
MTMAEAEPGDQRGEDQRSMDQRGEGQRGEGQRGEEAVHARLDMLLDLFRRRLQDDRAKAKAIDELASQLRAAEEGHFRQVLHPLVRRLAFVVDRLDAYAGTDPDFVGSVREEILDVLLDHGIRSIDVGPEFDPATQEAVGTEVTAAGVTAAGPGTVRPVRRGFAHGDWVFRPAQVIVATRGDAAHRP